MTTQCISNGSTWQAAGGGSGGTNALGLKDASVTATSTVVTIAFPAAGTNFTCGDKTVNVTGNATITLGASSAGAGSQAWVYYDCASNTLKLDTNANMTQANITVSGIAKASAVSTAMPSDVVGIARLTAGDTGVNQWNAGQPATDFRTSYGHTVVKSGAFMIRTLNSDGSTTLALDTTKLSNPSGTTLATTTGTLTNGHSVNIDASGNLLDSGGAAGVPVMTRGHYIPFWGNANTMVPNGPTVLHQFYSLVSGYKSHKIN